MGVEIDWQHFTPWLSLIGGAILGIAASLFVLGNNRILGISGIVGGLLKRKEGDIAWRLRFLLGMALAPWGYAVFAPQAASFQIDSGYGVIILAGVLVGVGTRFASGCTSGHGVCGISRLSPRSIVATVCFMSTGFLMVYLLRHVF